MVFNATFNNISGICLPEKFCAFINYSTKDSAGKAMNHLQVTLFLNT
jgi:hypothetical protein